MQDCLDTSWTAQTSLIFTFTANQKSQDCWGWILVLRCSVLKATSLAAFTSFHQLSPIKSQIVTNPFYQLKTLITQEFIPNLGLSRKVSKKKKSAQWGS